MLQVYRQTEGGEPPPAFVLCICGDRFDLGEGLSPTAHERLAEAMALLEKLFRQPTLAAWSSLVTMR